MILSVLASAELKIRPLLSLWVRDSHCSTDLPSIWVSLKPVLEQSWSEVNKILLCVMMTQKMLINLKILVYPAAQGRTLISIGQLSWELPEQLRNP